MRKFISPIINILSLILVGIAYGLAGITAAYNANDVSVGNYYQLVWHNQNAFNLVGFFLIIAASVMVLVTFIPKIRKFTSLLTAGLLIAGGVMALMAPAKIQEVASSNLALVIQPGLIGMVSLLFVAAFFSLVIFVIEFITKE